MKPRSDDPEALTEIKWAIGHSSDKLLSGAGRFAPSSGRPAPSVWKSIQVVGMTGTPGHKTSLRLIESEAYRRIMSGEAPETLADFAQQLLDWFGKTYPAASPMALTAVEDQIRETWHRRHEMIRGG